MRWSPSFVAGVALAALVAPSAFAQPAPVAAPAPSVAPSAPPAAASAPSSAASAAPSSAPSPAPLPSLAPPSAAPPSATPAPGRADHDDAVAEPPVAEGHVSAPARSRNHHVALPAPHDAEPVVVAAAPAPEPPDDAPKPLKKYVQRKLEIATGLRTVVVRGAGFDPYAKTDVLPGPAIGVRATVLDVKPFSVSLLAGYEPSFASATARGQETHLVSHRIALGVEGRLAFGHRVALFGRATPGLLHVRGSIDDPGVPELVSRTWTWSVDATGGLALLVGRVGDPDWPAVQFWLTGEVGYAFAGEVAMAFTPNATEDDPRRYGGVDLPALSLSGVTDRLTFAVSF